MPKDTFDEESSRELGRKAGRKAKAAPASTVGYPESMKKRLEAAIGTGVDGDGWSFEITEGVKGEVPEDEEAWKMRLRQLGLLE